MPTTKTETHQRWDCCTAFFRARNSVTVIPVPPCVLLDLLRIMTWDYETWLSCCPTKVLLGTDAKIKSLGERLWGYSLRYSLEAFSQVYVCMYISQKKINTTIPRAFLSRISTSSVTFLSVLSTDESVTLLFRVFGQVKVFPFLTSISLESCLTGRSSVKQRTKTWSSSQKVLSWMWNWPVWLREGNAKN